MKSTHIETFTLDVEQFFVAKLVDESLFACADNTKVEAYFVAEALAYGIQASFRVPAKILQEREVIASWPSSLWQHIRKSLGLSYKSTSVILTEKLLFPNAPIPESWRRGMRVNVQALELTSEEQEVGDE